MARRALRKALWLSLVLAVLLVGLVVFLRTVHVPGKSDLLAKPLVGSWTLPQPAGAGTTRILTLRADGTMSSVDYQDSSGVRLKDTSGYWRVDGSTLVFRQRQNGLNVLFGGSYFPEEQMPIISVTDTELRLGTPQQPLVYSARRN